MASQQTHYPVYLTDHLGVKLDHQCMFVFTDPINNKGIFYHSVGSLQNGMIHKFNEGYHPFEALSCVWIQHKGWISHENFSKVEEICRGIPPPAKQYQGNKLLVKKSELRHCQHWVAEAMEALKAAGVLEPLGPGDSDAKIEPQR